MRTITLSLLLMVTSMSSAQQYAWSRKITGSASASGLSTYMDAAGNSYTVGAGQGTYDLNPGSGVANVSVSVPIGSFVTKLDPGGNYVWGTALQATITDLVVAPDNSIHLLGRFQDTQDLNPGSGVANVTSAGSMDGFVVKLDGSGTFQWVARLGGVGNDCVMEAIIDPSGNLLCTGWVDGSVDFDPGSGTTALGATGSGSFLWRLSPSGTLVDASIMGSGNTPGSTAQGWAISLDDADNIYLTGYFKGQVDMDPGAGTTLVSSTTPSVDDIYVTKLTPGGSLSWTRQFSGMSFSSYIYADPLATDPTGNVFLGGRFSGTADLDPGTGTNSVTSAGATDLFVVKLSSNGDHLWGHRIGGTNDDSVVAIGCDGSGNAYATGLFRGNVDFDPGAGSFPLNGSMISGFALSLGSNGGFSWAGAFAGSLNTFGTGIGCTPQGDVVFSGSLSSTIDADPGPGNAPLSSSANGDVYIIRLQAGTTGTTEIGEHHDNLVLYPNPANERLSIRMGDAVQDARFSVFDGVGRTVMAMPFSGLEAQLVTAGMADGLYVLELRTADGLHVSKRFVVRH